MSYKNKIFSYNLLLPFLRGKRFIFLYHDISNGHEPHHSDLYSTTIENFERQIDFLSRLFKFVSLEELLQPGALPGRYNYASITFDDGYHSVLSAAHPILSALKIPFTVFVNRMAAEKNNLWHSQLVMNNKNQAYLKKIYTAYLAEAPVSFGKFCESPLEYIMEYADYNSYFTQYVEKLSDYKVYLDAADIQQLHRSGAVIGSHTVSHPVLSKCKDEHIEKEITENKKFLETLLRGEIRHFAVPFGQQRHFNKKVLECCRQAGHQQVYSTIPTYVSGRSIHEAVIPRIMLTNHNNKEIMYLINRAILIGNKINSRAIE